MITKEIIRANKTKTVMIVFSVLHQVFLKLPGKVSSTLWNLSAFICLKIVSREGESNFIG